MGKTCRRNTLFFFAGILACCAVAVLVYSGFISEQWVYVDVKRTILDHMNKSSTYEAGWTEFGLIKGSKLLKPYLHSQTGRKTPSFTVFDEFKDVFNLNILYAVIACLVVAALVLVLTGALSFYNEFTKSSYVILGSTGLYILNSIAFFFIFLAICLFAGLYHQEIRKNVLTQSELDDGFNSDGKASLQFSFWILFGAMFLPLINLALTFLNSARAKKYFNKTSTIQTTNVDGMMLY